MEKKITKREKFNLLLTIVEDRKDEMFGECSGEELVAFLEHEIELLDRKKGGSSKPSKTQLENERLKEIVYKCMVAEGKPLRIAEIKALDEELAELSTPKVTPMLTKLVKEGRAERTVVKKASFYKAIV